MWPRRFPWPLRWWTMVYLVPRTLDGLHLPLQLTFPAAFPAAFPAPSLDHFLHVIHHLSSAARHVPPQRLRKQLPAFFRLRRQHVLHVLRHFLEPLGAVQLPDQPRRPFQQLLRRFPKRRHHRDLQHPRRYRTRHRFRAQLRLVDQQVLEPRHPPPLRRRVHYQFRKLPLVLPPLRSLIAPENRRFQRRLSPSRASSLGAVVADKLLEYQRHQQRQPLFTCSSAPTMHGGVRSDSLPLHWRPAPPPPRR